MEEKISLIKLEMKAQHFENMEIMETLEKLNDSIDILKLLMPNSSGSSTYDNHCRPSSTRPPPINQRIETKFNGLKKTLFDSLEKKQMPRTNIPINTKYLTLKRNCTLSNHQNSHTCDDYYRIKERSKSKTKATDTRPLAYSQNKPKFTNVDNGMSAKSSKIRTPTLVKKNLPPFSANNKSYHSNNGFTNGRICSNNVDLIRLKLNAKRPEYNSSINESSHLKFEDRKILNQIYYI